MNVYRESRDVPTQQMLTFAGGGGACHMWLSSKFETWYFSPRLHYVMSCENQNSNSMKFLTFLTQLFHSVSNDYEMKTKLLVMCAFSSVQINAKMVFFRYAAICAAHPFINTSTTTLCTQSIRRCLSSSMSLCVAGGRLYRAVGEWVVTSSMTRVIACDSVCHRANEVHVDNLYFTARIAATNNLLTNKQTNL